MKSPPRIKAVFIGDSGVGKSCLYSQLETGTYDEDHLPTIGGSFATITVTASDGSSYEVGLWDTAGQDRYKDIIPMYFERADFVLAVFAINDRETFDHLTEWLNRAREKIDEFAKIIIIGNKLDLAEQREVQFEEMVKFAEKQHAAFSVEASARTSAGLDLIVQGIAQEWLAGGGDRPRGKLVTMTIDDGPPKRKGCC
jgi:small GTP-binding protein